MNRFSLALALCSSLSLCLTAAACSPDSSAAPAPGGEANPASNAAEANPQAASSPALAAACDAAFDALLARVAKCGPGSTMDLVPVERSRVSFQKLCSVRGSRPGTGYTAAFHTRCASVLATASCNDDDAIVEACWEPAGELARGLPCNTDDQCKDRFCVLPSGAASGASCGVCGSPAWKQATESCEESDNDKCEPGTRCGSFAGGPKSCMPALGIQRGDRCRTNDLCRFGLACKEGHCLEGKPHAAVGESCGAPDYSPCEFGALCDGTDLCIPQPVVDEPAGKALTMKSQCDSWTVESATKKCVVRAALACN